MKKLLIIMLMVSAGLFACANNGKKGVSFEKGTFKQILAKAADEKKPVFIDIYATWCAPCKYMSSVVFTNEKAGKYFNGNFVNAKFDAEKGEGVAIARTYRVTAYPTLLVLNHEGEELGRIVGAKEADDLISSVKKIIDPKK